MCADTSHADKLHADEADIDASLVRRLLAAQFPQWADLPVVRVDNGTSNAMYRLGDTMVVRLPRREAAAADVDREHRWLPRIAPSLPFAVPVPLGKGRPVADYPWAWSVYRWLEGETPTAGGVDRTGLFARDLAEFVRALRRIDPTDGPPSYRSEHLAARDTATRAAIGELHGIVDARAATAVWEAALRAPEWRDAPVWIHADLQPGNVLTVRGRLSAVIDFGCTGLGDPAVDLLPAWYLLGGAARDVFRTSVEADDASWARGRGWALSVALMEVSYYRHSDPVMHAVGQHVIGEVLAGQGDAQPSR
ncbi:aminoglycoside phosphotransferase family protein [Streptomyces sp. SID3212]|uniref:aminoglycoside phosphotransferase family protein n=1 Tax=Streptomyces sp. SID3212 TaxID=2690259 RepID=UPI00136CDC7B|nr:aminoglycoside phosphotransferase family protein [Streptomyces sp. SID3212]MYV54366.1 phosphotransferase [Streptomyces sp. SID3212]